MSDASVQTQVYADSQLALSRAVRFALAAIVLGLSYPNIWCASHIGGFEQVYADMLGNRPLPGATAFLIEYRSLFVTLSILWPLAAVSAIFTSGLARSVYISGFLVLGTFGQLFFQWYTLTGPLLLIIKGMQG